MICITSMRARPTEHLWSSTAQLVIVKEAAVSLLSASRSGYQASGVPDHRHSATGIPASLRGGAGNWARSSPLLLVSHSPPCPSRCITCARRVAHVSSGSSKSLDSSMTSPCTISGAQSGRSCPRLPRWVRTRVWGRVSVTLLRPTIEIQKHSELANIRRPYSRTMART